MDVRTYQCWVVELVNSSLTLDWFHLLRKKRGEKRNHAIKCRWLDGECLISPVLWSLLEECECARPRWRGLEVEPWDAEQCTHSCSWFQHHGGGVYFLIVGRRDNCLRLESRHLHDGAEITNNDVHTFLCLKDQLPDNVIEVKRSQSLTPRDNCTASAYVPLSSIWSMPGGMISRKPEPGLVHSGRSGSTSHIFAK